MSERYIPSLQTESARDISDSVQNKTQNSLHTLSEEIFRGKTLTVKTRDKGGKGNLMVRVGKEYKYTLSAGEKVTATGKYEVRQDVGNKNHLWLEISIGKGSNRKIGWVSSKYLVGDLSSSQKNTVNKGMEPVEIQGPPKPVEIQGPPKPVEKNIEAVNTDTILMTGGDYGLPLLPENRIIRKNGQLYDLSDGLHYEYKKGDTLGGHQYEKHKQDGLLYDNGKGKIMIQQDTNKTYSREEIINKVGTEITLDNDWKYLGIDGKKRRITKLTNWWELKDTNPTGILEAIEKNRSNNSKIVHYTDGKTYFVEKTEEEPVYNRSEIVDVIGEAKQLDKNLTYTGDDGIRRKIYGWRNEQCLEILPENSKKVFDTIHEKGKENVRFVREDKGTEWIVFDLKKDQEGKEIQIDDLEFIDYNNIHSWPIKDGKIVFPELNQMWKKSWEIEFLQDGIFEPGVELEGVKYGKKDLLHFVYTNAEGKQFNRIGIKNGQVSTFGPAELLKGIENLGEIAAMVTDNWFETPQDYSSTLKTMKQKALQLKEESSSEEELIGKIYEHIKDNTSYNKKMGKYFESLYKFYENQTNEKPIKPKDAPEDSSGAHVYKSGSGTCRGFSEAFIILLSFAGIKGVKRISGITPNEEQLKTKGTPRYEEVKKEMRHTWVKIGDKHYDVTYDDDGNRENVWYGLTDQEAKEQGREWVGSESIAVNEGAGTRESIYQKFEGIIELDEFWSYRGKDGIKRRITNGDKAKWYPVQESNLPLWRQLQINNPSQAKLVKTHDGKIWVIFNTEEEISQ